MEPRADVRLVRHALIKKGSGLAERFLSDDFEDDSIELITAVIEPELTFFEVQVEGSFRDTMELHQPPFRERPEGLDAVDVGPATSEFVLSVLHPEVLLVAEIDQAVIPAPSVGVNDAVEADSSPDNGLQRGFSAVGDDLGVDHSISLEDSKNRCLSSGSAASLALDALAAKIGFIDFDFPGKGRFVFAKLGDSLSDKAIVSVNRVAVEASDGCSLASVQIQGETAYQLPEFGLRNS